MKSKQVKTLLFDVRPGRGLRSNCFVEDGRLVRVEGMKRPP
jgi:hypothetical protein